MGTQHPEDLERLFRTGPVRTLSIDHGDWIISFTASEDYPFAVRKKSPYSYSEVFTRIDAALRYIKNEETLRGRQ
jgi:hypothetical protein